MHDGNAIWTFLQSLISVQQAEILVYLLFANFILGVVAAIKTKTFEAVKMLDFWKRVAFTFGAYLALSFAAHAADFSALRDATMVSLVAYLVAQIKTNVEDLTGIKVPASINKYIERVPGT